MRAKISCSAPKLSLLSPAMVQTVVQSSVFQVANQYFSENRVRIIQADEAQIVSAVIGITGVHEQTIRLSDGQLATQCSCSQLNEQPLCRHATAVLLEYHRGAQAQAKAQAMTLERKPAAPTLQAPAQPKAASAMDIKFSDVSIFIEWLQTGVRALESGGELAAPPQLEPGEVMGWIKALQVLDERRRASEDRHAALEADVHSRDAEIVRLTQQVQSSLYEAKEARAACQHLERELAGHRVKMAKLFDLAGEFTRFDSQMKALAGELVRNAANLDSLCLSFKEAATTLQGVAESRPIAG